MGSSKENCFYTNCVVRGLKAPDGFVAGTTGTNVFKSCRASGVFGGWRCGAFVGTLNRFSLAEDCAGYGVSDDEANGFAGVVSTGATVRRCVGALLPFPSQPAGAGFADTISYDSVVEDCYSVYAPTLIPRYAGQQGGFVLETSLGRSSSQGSSSGTDKLARCFALGVIPGPTLSGNGSFCGGTPYYPLGATYNVRFEDCYRPAESPVADFNGQDHAGVGALTKAQFASATSATMPHYDFANVWHAPNGVASSPYLDASTDANGKFWFYGTLLSGEGRILVNDAEPAEAYPAGARIKVKAVCNSAGMPFTGWVGEGFDDPTAQETWYTVKNVSAIAATFGTPIYTVDDWTNHISRASEPSGTYALMNDLDFSEYIASNGWGTVRVTNFKGKLFGQGHTIRGLTWNGASVNRWVGLFSSYTGAGEAPAVHAGAEIRDLNVESVVSSNFSGNAAGLVSDVRSDCLISNCHAKVDFNGDYIYQSGRETSCFYGLVGWAEGTNIRIIDCSAEGTMIGCSEVAGFIGSANLTDGEIARCSAMGVFCATNGTTTPYGRASGFAATIDLSGGATVRECFSAGVVDGVGDAAGFASDKIGLDDAASCVRDCYSTAEVIGGRDRDIAGFAVRVSDSNYSGVTVSNCWFGGSVRAHGGVTGSYKPRGFVKIVDNDVAFPNCKWVRVDAATVGTDGVGELDRDEARAPASWSGYDFGGVWSLDEGYTSPYFAWSLDGGGFRVFADEDEGTAIAHPATATPGDFAEISASATDPDLFFCQWTGGAVYTNAVPNPSAILADNHRAVRAAWGKAITTRAELEAITNDLAGTYGLGCDIDLGGEPWTPIGSDSSMAFSGTLYGQGHTISNLVVDTDGGSYAGLFGYVAGGKIADLALTGADVAGGENSSALAGYLDGAAVENVVVADPVVRGGGLTGGLAGRARDSVVTDCSVVGADVASAGGDRTGMFVGEADGGTRFARCRASGTVASPSSYVGGFAGYADSAAFSQCCALGTVTAMNGSHYGGFAGCIVNDSTSFSECFACGAVAASGRDYVGGFAGYVGDDPVFSDCYSLVDVTGGRYVGGFAGQTSYCEGTFTRCYTAGATAGSSDVGGFVGSKYGSSYNPTYANCFRIDDGLADVGAADLSGIDLAGRDWTPIGNTESLKFTGAFYGNGHAVKNLTCTNNPSNSSNKWRGLFGCAAGATIDGVAVENCDIAGYQYIGALVGRIYDGTAITGCSASGRVYGYNGYAGGLVGACDDGAFLIRGSAAAVEVTGGSNQGGFIGRVYGSGASVIADCRADGFACGTGSVGGFVGYVSAPLFTTNCAARGDVKSTGSSYGGFVGYVSNAGATNIACWCSGAVWGTGNNIGSFVGQSSNGSFVDCSVYPYANGLRPFCGSSASVTGGVLSAAEVRTRSAGWPKVAKRENTVPAIPVATVEELFAVTNNLTTNYVLTADIDLGGAAWTPIGQSTAFTGEFYGRNHAISNFTVTTTAQNAGLFGKIGGGRVSGVRAYGHVTGSNSYVGGFAGKIESYSMVDGCLFEGDVASSSTYVGGFVGQTYGSPNILRCSASGTVAKTDTSTGAGYIGGFVGQHYAGWISDSYALASVNAGKAGTAGGFVGNMGSASSARIATSYCSASIATNSFSYIGAFGGNVAAGSVTNAYYNSGATPLLAQGQSNKASIDYVGITPVAGANMKKQTSFPALDFETTWKIDEGETMPYLLTFTVQKTGYELWLEDNGLPEDTAPEAEAEGVPYLIRYVFDRPTGAFSPFKGISFNDDGDVVISMLTIEKDEGVTVKVLASTSLTDWSHAVETEITVQSDGTLVFPRTADPARFFKLSVSED